MGAKKKKGGSGKKGKKSKVPAVEIPKGFLLATPGQREDDAKFHVSFKLSLLTAKEELLLRRMDDIESVNPDATKDAQHLLYTRCASAPARRKLPDAFTPPHISTLATYHESLEGLHRAKSQMQVTRRPISSSPSRKGRWTLENLLPADDDLVHAVRDDAGKMSPSLMGRSSPVLPSSPFL